MLYEVITGIDGLVDVNVEQQIEVPQIQIIPDRDRLAVYGITRITSYNVCYTKLLRMQVLILFVEK